MRLIADIGGTNARFALSPAPGRFGSVTTLPVSAHPSFENALGCFMAAQKTEIDSAAVAAAGPVVDGAIEMTNAAWTIDATAFVHYAPVDRVRIVNDLAAVAHALSLLGAEGVQTLQSGPPGPDRPRIAVNVGTGFGAAVWLPGGRVLPTEAGHMTVALRGHEELRLFGSGMTIEDVLSGPGLQRLLDRFEANDLRVAFSRLLGRVAGDLVLATGSWGGAYLCGGVLTDLEEHIDLTRLLEGFSDRSGLAARLGHVPFHHIVHPAPALLGLSVA